MKSENEIRKSSRRDEEHEESKGDRHFELAKRTASGEVEREGAKNWCQFSTNRTTTVKVTYSQTEIRRI